jgi:nucleotide-binding universal stress UspA family protein
MKKVLIAFDGTEFSEGAFEFARSLNELQPLLLTGLFIPQLSYANLWSYTGAMAGDVYVPMIEPEEGGLLQKNIDHFQELCIRNGISFRVHRDFNDFALPELRRETRFADLLIISSESFFNSITGAEPSDYMKEAIHESECAVIVIPEKCSFPLRNVIAYDGSASSVYALKQFAYLFPELSNNETLLVCSKNDDDTELPSEDYIEELASQHFKNLSLLKLKVNPRKYFNSWLSGEGSPILICGALGRSTLSRLFKKSFVTEVISDHKLPVFIAHL